MRCCAVPKGTEESQSRHIQGFRAGLITFAPEGAYAVPKGTRNLVTTPTQHSAPKAGAPCWAKLCRAFGTVAFPFASSTTSDEEPCMFLAKSDRPSMSGGNQPSHEERPPNRPASSPSGEKRKASSEKRPLKNRPRSINARARNSLRADPTRWCFRRGGPRGPALLPC